MRIRTITAGIHLNPSKMEEQIEKAGEFLAEARERYLSEGIEVQTLRLSTQPWTGYSMKLPMEGLIPMIMDLESHAIDNGIDFVSIGPCNDPSSIDMVPNILSETTYICTSAELVDGHVLEENIKSCARAVQEIAFITRDGARNFMFAATASCPPDIPFFPASYHSGTVPSFSIGLENGDLVYSASSRSPHLQEFMRYLSHSYQEVLETLEAVAVELNNDTDHEFRGVDLSFAPGLTPDASIALAIERLTGSPFGSHGTLSAAAAITRSLDRIKIKRCGYCGLMLPILEDEGLASAADLGSLDLQKLLLYSSVCGTGLDAVPLPGDTSEERIASVLRDVASLSLKWNKPLSARLLPIPDKISGERTELNTPYLRDCSILSVI